MKWSRPGQFQQSGGGSVLSIPGLRWGQLAVIRHVRRRARRESSISRVDVALEDRRLLTAVTFSDEEQLLLELVNRARANPGAEAARYGVGLNDGLTAGTITADPKQPLAPNQVLANAAAGHSVDMLNRDFFAHDTPDTPPVTATQRMKNAGYTTGVLYSENIAWEGTTDVPTEPQYLQYLLNAHERLFKSSGHRRNMLHPSAEELGNGIERGLFTGKDTNNVTRTFNALMVTENFGSRNSDPFITGVVYSDLNSDSFYSLGEAIRSGTVTATNTSTGAMVSDAIGNSGGYQLIVPAGTWQVDALYRVGSTNFRITRTVVVDSQNVKADFLAANAVPVGISLTPATATIREQGADTTTLMTLTRSGSTSGILTVNLASSDTTESTVPATVTIPDGQSSVQFSVAAVSDGLIDGSQVATITASVSGYDNATARITTLDSTVPVLPGSLLTSPGPRPVISWTGISNAANYEIWISNDSTKQGRYLVQGGIVGTTFTPVADLPVGNYRIWVRGLTAESVASAWSAAQSMRIVTPPAIVGSGAVHNTTQLSIQWTPVPGAAAYEVWVDRLSTGEVAYHRQSNVTGTTLALSDIPLGQYAFWVRARNAAGHFGNWSPRGTFTVNMQPMNLRVTGADFDSVPTLAWDSVPGAAAYDVWVNNASSGNTLLLRNTSVPGTSLTFEQVPPAGTCRVWVRARDAKGGNYLWSTAFDFQFNRPSRILTPLGGGQPSAPTFSWTTVSGAARYELWVSSLASGGGRVIHETSLTTTSFTPLTPLSAGSYRTWIRAVDSNGKLTSWSSASDFTVVSTESRESEFGPFTPDTSSRLVSCLRDTGNAVTGQSTDSVAIDEVFSDETAIQQMAEDALAASGGHAALPVEGGASAHGPARSSVRPASQARSTPSQEHDADFIG